MNKLYPKYYLLLLIFVFASFGVLAQAPVISVPASRTFTEDAQITPISITNTGGAVPLRPYLEAANFSTSSIKPYYIAKDHEGNFYSTCNSDNRVYKITSSGGVSVYAGAASSGYVDGDVGVARFNSPRGLACDSLGNLYVAEINSTNSSNSRVRKITPAGQVSTLVTGLIKPEGVMVSRSGAVYVTEEHRIRKVNNDGSSYVFAGKETASHVDGQGTAAMFNTPVSMIEDRLGYIYVAERVNRTIRRISHLGQVTTYAGKSATNSNTAPAIADIQFGALESISFDQLGNMIVAESQPGWIRKISPDGTISYIANGHYLSSMLVDLNNNIKIANPNNPMKELKYVGYLVKPELPKGLVLDSTGVIRGTPLQFSEEKDHLITAKNVDGESTATLSLSVQKSTDPPLLGSFSLDPSSFIVTVTGINLRGITSATIGNKTATSIEEISSREIRLTIPARTSSGSISVTNTYGTSSVTGYVQAPAIDLLYPLVTTQGSVITLMGEGLSIVTAIKMGETDLSFTIINDTKIEVIAPANSGRLSIVNPRMGLTTTDITVMAITSFPEVAALGEEIDIRGRGLSNASIVRVGTAAATSFTIQGDTLIKAVVGNTLSGTVSITTPAGTVTSSTMFTVMQRPIITSLSTQYGTSGTVVDINGTNLGAVSSVSFGGVSGTIVSVTATKVRAKVSSGASGDIILTNAAGADTIGGFQFIPPPKIASMRLTLGKLSHERETIIMTPAFSPDVLSYEAEVFDISSAWLEFPLSNDVGSVTINGISPTIEGSPNRIASITLNLNQGYNTFTIRIRSTDNTRENTYTIVLKRTPIPILTSIGLENLFPAFSPWITEYEATVDKLDRQLSVYPGRTDGVTEYPIYINGVNLPFLHMLRNNVMINQADSTIKVEIKSVDLIHSRTYAVKYSRAKLSSLTINRGTVQEVLAPGGATAYTATVDHNVSKIDIVAVSKPNERILVDSAGVGVIVNSGSIISNMPLKEGENKFVLRTLVDNAFKFYYEFTITRLPDPGALRHLTLSAGSLTPHFSSTTKTYRSIVPYGTSSITITPVLADTTSSVKVNGLSVIGGAESGKIDLEVGVNEISIVLTGRDGAIAGTYMIIVTRQHEPTLTALNLGSVLLSPAFSPATFTYTAAVSAGTSSVIVTPTAGDPTAAIKINNVLITNGATKSLPLVQGSNLIDIVVTLADSVTKRTYSIDINRAAPSTTSSLSALNGSSGSLNPVFSSGTMSYSLALANNVSSIKVTGTPTDTTARMKVNGVALANNLASGDLELAVGDNTISVSVTAQDGITTSTYKINVKRAALNQALPDNSGSVAINPSAPQVLILEPTTPITVSVPSGVTNASLNYSSMISSGTGTIPQTTVTSALASMAIPASTKVTSSSTSWNGVINMPSPTTYQLQGSPGEIITYGAGIEVGSPDVSLEFDKAIRLVLPGQAGKRAGFVRLGVFTEITTIGSTDSQAEGDALPAKGAYKIDSGADLVIWTKGFSKFITFTRSIDPDVALLALDKGALTEALILGENISLQQVHNSLSNPLPASGTNGSSITWTSSHPSLISASGVLLTRPAGADVVVTLTASLKKGLITDTKSFTVTLAGTLPLNNIKAQATAVSCKGSANGAISITAIENLSYTATISGAVNQTLTFSNSLNLNDLAAGTYNICITASGLSAYKQCFELVVAEPKDLAAYAVVNKEDKTLSLDLSGAERYEIELNGKVFSTDKNSMLLSLEPGENRIKISTDKVCQGVVEHLVSISRPLPYPNPFENSLSIELGNKMIRKVVAELQDLSGRISYREQFANQSGTLNMNIPNLGSGVYLLRLSLDGKESVHKVMKK